MSPKGTCWYTENLNFKQRLHNATPAVSCRLLFPSRAGSLVCWRGFPGMSFTCQQALGLILTEVFICAKPAKDPTSCPTAHVGTRGQSWEPGTVRILPPLATSQSGSSPARSYVWTTKEELVGVIYPLLVRPCHWRHHTRPLHVPIHTFSCQQSYIISTNNVARLTKHYLQQKFSCLSFPSGGVMVFCSPASISAPETFHTIDQALLLLQNAANLDQCLTFHLLVISLDLHALKLENEIYYLDPLSFHFALGFCYYSWWSGKKFWDKFSKATSNPDLHAVYVGKAVDS